LWEQDKVTERRSRGKARTEKRQVIRNKREIEERKIRADRS
jgi:hypothetical protein